MKLKLKSILTALFKYEPETTIYIITRITMFKYEQETTICIITRITISLFHTH